MRILLFALLAIVPSLFSQNANHLVIAEVYGGSGTTGAACKNDFILLYNPTSASIELSTWSIQKASGSGTTWSQLNLQNSIGAYSYYLIQLRSGGSNGISLSNPNVTNSSIDIPTGSGKLALCDNQSRLDGQTPLPNSHIIDFVGWGAASEYEGRGNGGAPALSTTNKCSTARKRWDGGSADTAYGFGNAYDTDNNLNDFYQRTSFLSVLPIELKSFTARFSGGKIMLNWASATEINNAYFLLTRYSPKGKNDQWQVIAKIEGAGNSNSICSYSFCDSDIRLPGIYRYKLLQIDNDGTKRTAGTVEQEVNELPNRIFLQQNFPNPFNPGTVIHFNLLFQTRVELTVFDMPGRKIQTIYNGICEAGLHVINWQAGGLASGVYFFELKTDEKTERIKMVKRK